jgi:hypothetical protein
MGNREKRDKKREKRRKREIKHVDEFCVRKELE